LPSIKRARPRLWRWWWTNDPGPPLPHGGRQGAVSAAPCPSEWGDNKVSPVGEGGGGEVDSVVHSTCCSLYSHLPLSLSGGHLTSLPVLFQKKLVALFFFLPYPQEVSIFFKVEMNCGIMYLMRKHRRAGSVRTYASGEGIVLVEGGSFHLYRWERRSQPHTLNEASKTHPPKFLNW